MLLQFFLFLELNYLVDFVLSMRWNDPRLNYRNLKQLYDLNALPMNIMEKVGNYRLFRQEEICNYRLFRQEKVGNYRLLKVGSYRLFRQEKVGNYRLFRQEEVGNYRLFRQEKVGNYRLFGQGTQICPFGNSKFNLYEA